jgi:hypothetical protein
MQNITKFTAILLFLESKLCSTKKISIVDASVELKETPVNNEHDL